MPWDSLSEQCMLLFFMVLMDIVDFKLERGYSNYIKNIYINFIYN